MEKNIFCSRNTDFPKYFHKNFEHNIKYWIILKQVDCTTFQGSKGNKMKWTRNHAIQEPLLGERDGKAMGNLSNYISTKIKASFRAESKTKTFQLTTDKQQG